MLNTEFIGITEEFSESINIFNKKLEYHSARSDSQGSYSKLTCTSLERLRA